MTLSEFRYKLESKVDEKEHAASEKPYGSSAWIRDTAFAEGLTWALGFLEKVEEENEM